MNDINPAIAARAAQEKERGPSDDQLVQLRDLLAQARDKEEEKAFLEERLKTVNKELTELQFRTLPDAFEELGISSFTLAPDGNHPAVTAEAKPYFKANIAASWPADKRQEAFQYLTETGHEDLIKTKLVLAFPRAERAAAKEIISELRKRGLSPEIKEDVPHSTLTAWLKEQVEKFQQLPDLEKIGGAVGRIVNLKRKDD